MFRLKIDGLFRGGGRRRDDARRQARRDRAIRGLAPERLDARVTPAVVATFSPGAGLLTVFGDALDNTMTISRDAAGKVLVNGGAVNVIGGTPTVANTSLI